MVEKKKILFVCLGNTCRSPIAEGVFQKCVNELGQGELWEVDSAGLKDWHEGKRPNYMSLEVMKNKKVPYNYESRSRPITSADYEYYNYIIGMDSYIMHDLERFAPDNSIAQLLLFGDYDPEGLKDMQDPYGITSADYEYYNYIIGMDSYIMHDLERFAPDNSIAQLLLFGDYDPEGLKDMQDPYGDRCYQVFEDCYEHCLRCANGFLQAVGAIDTLKMLIEK